MVLQISRYRCSWTKRALVVNKAKHPAPVGDARHTARASRHIPAPLTFLCCCLAQSCRHLDLVALSRNSSSNNRRQALAPSVPPRTQHPRPVALYSATPNRNSNSKGQIMAEGCLVQARPLRLEGRAEDCLAQHNRVEAACMETRMRINSSSRVVGCSEMLDSRRLALPRHQEDCSGRLPRNLVSNIHSKGGLQPARSILQDKIGLCAWQ